MGVDFGDLRVVEEPVNDVSDAASFGEVGHTFVNGLKLTLRNGIEPWLVLGEEATGGGTSRYVDSSLERVERYCRLWTDNMTYEIRDHEDGILFLLHRHGRRRLGMRLSNEATIASATPIR